MDITDMIARVRLEIGDPPQPFRSTSLGDGQTVLFDLPRQELCESSLLVEYISGTATVTLADYSSAPGWSSATAYTTGQPVNYENYVYVALAPSTGVTPVPGGNSSWSDVTSTAYVVNATRGKITLGAPVPLNATLIITGSSWSLFSDRELMRIVLEATAQHTYAQETEERYRDARGFIDYRETAKTLQNLPLIEHPLLVMLATINVFVTLSNDAATDANVQTAEGTVIDRTTRYGQLMRQIEFLTQRYTDYCAQLNVGIFRWETLNLRRVSKTTGRLVPLFKDREYDDHRWPTRMIPPIDARNQDISGLPSPLWSPSWGT